MRYADSRATFHEKQSFFTKYLVSVPSTKHFRHYALS
jgi:hypothetical protein